MLRSTRRTPLKKILWRHLDSKAGFFSRRLYFHINSEAYGTLIPVIDFIAVEIHGKISRIIVYTEEGLKHETCFKHGLKWLRLRALGGKKERGFAIVEMSCECSALLMSLQQHHLISRFQERQCSKVQKRVSLLCSFSVFLFIVNNGVSISEHYYLFLLPHRLNPSKTSGNYNYQHIFNI